MYEFLLIQVEESRFFHRIHRTETVLIKKQANTNYCSNDMQGKSNPQEILNVT